jgi:hypothetical protein
MDVSSFGFCIDCLLFAAQDNATGGGRLLMMPAVAAEPAAQHRTNRKMEHNKEIKNGCFYQPDHIIRRLYNFLSNPLYRSLDT